MSQVVLRLLQATLILAVPTVTAGYIYRRFQIPYALMSVGMLSFIGSFLLQTGGRFLLPDALLQSTVIGGALVGLLVAITDVLARFAGYQYLARNVTHRPHALMIGVGHAILPMLVIGFSFILLAMGQLNAGSLPNNLTSLSDNALAETIVNIAPLVLHMAVSWLVLETFLHSEVKWLFGAMLWVGLVSGTEAFLAEASRNREFFIAIWWFFVAVVSAVMLVNFRPPPQFIWTPPQTPETDVDFYY